MSAPSLYRRHRPRTFDDVVGQDHVVRTLRNAIEQDKVHHAYLFVGSRGTGKTSMAKILASCLDCERGGPTTTPCGECGSCVAIAHATSLDVVEMDAASNNSVDDVRELRERVQTTATGGRWRVYILDEAHMLTTQAWNALLKTLEEPPPQTVFVLATTEAHKVPATVVDRCHRFDFTRPTAEQIARVLRRVAEREAVELTPGACGLVARHANGSFRDALGTLEQLVTYAGSSVTEDDAVAVLGIGDEAQVFGAVDRVIAGDAPGVLRVVQDVASHGRDLGSFARELERHGRDLLVCCILQAVPPEVRLTPERDALLERQAQRIGREQAARLLELVAEALTAARDGADQRAMLELALVKSADPAIDPALRALQARLARVESRLQGGGTALTEPAAAPRPAASQPAPAAAPQQPSAPAPRARPVPQQTQPQPPPAAPQPPSEPLAAHPAPTPVVPSEPGQGAVPAGEPGDAGESGEPAGPPRPQLVPAPPAPTSAAASGLTVADLAAMWPGVLENLSGRDTLGAVALGQARPVDLYGEELVIAFSEDAAFYMGTANREERREALREALFEVTGVRLTARFELRNFAGAPPAAGDEYGQPLTPILLPAKPEVLDEQEVVHHLVTEFDAEDLADPDQEPS